MSLKLTGNKQGRLFMSALLAFGLAACVESDTNSQNDAQTVSVATAEPVKYPLVPAPKQLAPGAGVFTFTEDTRFVAKADGAAEVADFFRRFIAPATGLMPDIVETSEVKSGTVEFRLTDTVSSQEGYSLKVTADHILVEAGTPAGLFYGMQTLRQLMPVEIEKQFPTNMVDWTIPAVAIQDEPRFEYRGMHLDVSRTFFPPKVIKRYIDFIALHKMNKFHWHLTDNQGWRLEIKKYPKLTGVGATRRETIIGHTIDRDKIFDGVQHGGFYTQDDVRDIVAYAAERHVDVVPEIDIPGHATAMIVAYPELSCVDRKTEVTRSYGIFLEVLCPTETTFNFLDGVFAEMSELFPYGYFHIGGDEILRDQWEESAAVQAIMQREGIKDTLELQGYFVKEVEKRVAKYGRKIIGWNEILEGGINPSAVIMSWTGVKGGIEGAKHGHDVIMTPGTHTYFDQYQSLSLDEPMSIHDFTDLEEVYHYEPIPTELTAEEAKHIKGSQGQIWSEYIHDMRRIEHAILPRMGALAEVVWSAKDDRDWQGFQDRLPALFARYEAMDANPSYAIYKPSAHGKLLADGAMEVTLKVGGKQTLIRYTLDGSEPNWQSAIYEKPLVLSDTTTVRAIGQDPHSGALYGDTRLTFDNHKAVGKKIIAGQSSDLLLNGLLARDRIYQVYEWAGVEGEDYIAVIDLEAATEIQEVSVGIEAGQWRQLYRPQGFDVLTSDDNENWTLQGALDEAAIVRAGGVLTVSFDPVTARYVKVVAKNNATYFSEQFQKQVPTTVFIDEISVR